jgi:hypothetical protein
MASTPYPRTDAESRAAWLTAMNRFADAMPAGRHLQEFKQFLSMARLVCQDLDECQTTLANRKVIERAKGIIQSREGVPEQEAYRILQKASQDRSLPMADLAAQIVAQHAPR